MALTVKQLEELDLLNNNSEQFDDISDVSSDKEEVDEATAGALACRRQILERAIEFTNKVKQSHLSTTNDYRIGMLVYDSLNKRYARVAQSNLEKVHLIYITGGEAFLIGSSIVDIQPNKTSDNSEKSSAKELNSYLAPGNAAYISNNSFITERNILENAAKPEQNEVEIKQFNGKPKSKKKLDFLKNPSKEDFDVNNFFKPKDNKIKQLISNDLSFGAFCFERHLNLLYSIFLSSVIFFFNSNLSYTFGLSVFSNQGAHSVYTLFFTPKYIPLTSMLKIESSKPLESDFFGINIIKEMISCLLKYYSNKTEILLYTSQIEYLLYVKVKYIQRIKKLTKIELVDVVE